jgi:hypothetical protein
MYFELGRSVMARSTAPKWKKERIVDAYDSMDKKYYIFCEGEKTEPDYFEEIKNLIESNPMYKNKILVEIEGVGAETLKVLECAENYVNRNSIKDAEIWIVYDKDSFPASRFNAVESRINNLNISQKNVKYYAAWSNQCIEYWFMLHFSDYQSDNHRSDYISYLNGIFKEKGYKKYEKNNKKNFSILREEGNPELAIRYAEKRLQENSGKTPSDSAPATKVHLLYKELSKFFPK